MICQCCDGGSRRTTVMSEPGFELRVSSFELETRNSQLETGSRHNSFMRQFFLREPLLTMHKSRVISLGQRQQAVGQLITLARRNLVLVEGIRTTALAAESALTDIQVDE